MTIEIELSGDDVVEELTENYTFTQWVDERIEERIPEDVVRDRQLRDVVQQDDLASLMREAFSNYDTTWFGITTDAADGEQINQHLIDTLDSLPRNSVERCMLGKAFERAVLKVLSNVLAGEELVTMDGASLDGHLRMASERVLGTVSGEYTPQPEAEFRARLGAPQPAFPAHNIEELAYIAPAIPDDGLNHAQRKCVEVYVTSALPNARICEVVHQAMKEAFGTNGNPSVTVESIGTQPIR